MIQMDIAAAYAAQTEFFAARQYDDEPNNDNVFELMVEEGVYDACGTCLQLGRFCPTHMDDNSQGVRELAVA